MISPVQQELPVMAELMSESIARWSHASPESRGEVFTKPEVVSFMLDLVGWNKERIGADMCLLEPSCGQGSFLLEAVDRLLEAHETNPFENLEDMLRGVELNPGVFVSLHEKVENKLAARGFSAKKTSTLADAWLTRGDFLSTPFEKTFSHVVGNPPYVRLESVPRELMRHYRQIFRTLYDRADLYVAFFEKGLSLLRKDGRLAYICSDRWMKNKYGGPLREWISREFHLESYIDFSGCDAFHAAVSAYPAVTVIKKSSPDTTRVVQKTGVELEGLKRLGQALQRGAETGNIKKIPQVSPGNSPWLLTSGNRLDVIQSLEERFPTLEEAGCSVGIGVATGADKVFIGTNNELDVEPERKLPLVTRRDLRDHGISWQGKYVLNPYDGETNGLVNLEKFPRFHRYILSHRDAVQRRHVARKNPAAWFKTIDRITPSLLPRPKLLIPDIQGDVCVSLDPGQYYPHHNLYYVTSVDWNLSALQAVLRSPLAKAFVATYSLRMRGDYLRFQAQYLRRIRLPLWKDVPPDLQQQLQTLGTSGTGQELGEAVRSLYELSAKAWDRLFEDDHKARKALHLRSRYGFSRQSKTDRRIRGPIRRNLI